MRTLGVAILGASTYDNHPDDNNPRFKRSAEVFREAITNPNIIGERKHKVLYLFDRRYSQETIVKQIAKFVAKGNFDDVIIYYCGHGVVPLNSKKYIVQLRTTDRSAINSSGLKIGDLMHDLDRALLAKRTLLVLDACYSGDALKELMDGTFAATAIAEHFKENLVRESRAALVSSGLKEASKALTEDECTLFTGTLVDILKRGIARLPAAPTFSLQDLNNEIDQVIHNRLGPDAPTPMLQSLRGANIVSMPFFVNGAYKQQDNLAATDKPETAAIPSERVIEHEFWMDIRFSSDACDFEDLIAKFPGGIYANRAERRVHDQLKVEKDPAALERFLTLYGSSPRSSLALCRLASLSWPSLSASYDEAALRKFGWRFADTPYRVDAHERLAAVLWREIDRDGDRERLKKFLDEFHDTRFATVARKRLAAIEALPGGQDGKRSGGNFAHSVWDGLFRRGATAPDNAGAVYGFVSKLQVPKTHALVAVCIALAALPVIVATTKLFNWFNISFLGRASIDTGLFLGSLVVFVASAILLLHRRTPTGAELASYWVACSIAAFVGIAEIFVHVNVRLGSLSAANSGALVGAAAVLASGLMIAIMRRSVLASGETAIYWAGTWIAAYFLITSVFAAAGWHVVGNSALHTGVAGWAILFLILTPFQAYIRKAKSSRAELGCYGATWLVAALALGAVT